MSDDAWRRKGYYHTRVVIETNDVINSPFPDAVMCLTGQQLAMVRNITQYLHRRSTFASEYHDGYYLAPTNEEWDALDTIVADLEAKLMDCEAFTQILDDILEAALCACEGVGKGYGSPIVGPIYDDLEDDGTIEWALPDGTPIPAEDDRCALAQLVWAFTYEILTEYLQPLEEALHHILLPLVLAGIAVMLGGPVALVPGAALYAVITASLDAWVEGELESVLTAFITNKEDLVCAMYADFLIGGSYATAAAAAAAVIDTVEAFSPVDRVMFKQFLSPWVMEQCAKAWDGGSEWADDNVTPGYCADCEVPPIEGDGWIAYWAGVEYDYILTGSAYPGVNVNFPLASEKRLCGLLWEYYYSTVGTYVACANSPVGPPENRIWTDGHTGPSNAPRGQLSCNPTYLDADQQAEVKALLYPGAVSSTSMFNALTGVTPGYIRAYHQTNNHADVGKIRFLWIIYVD